MRKAALWMLRATPGVAVAYLLLLVYILNRVRPLPITFLPRGVRADVALQAA